MKLAIMVFTFWLQKNLKHITEFPSSLVGFGDAGKNVHIWNCRENEELVCDASHTNLRAEQIRLRLGQP